MGKIYLAGEIMPNCRYISYKTAESSHIETHITCIPCGSDVL